MAYESVYIISHDVYTKPPVTLQNVSMSLILKRHCRDHVPSAAEFGPSGRWSSTSTRFSMGHLAAVWGVVNTGPYFLCKAKSKRSRSEHAVGVASHGLDVIVFASCSKDLVSLKSLMSLLSTKSIKLGEI